MNGFVWFLAMIVGSLALTLTRAQYNVLKDMEADDEDALVLYNIIWKSRQPKAFHKVFDTAFGTLVQYMSWNDCGSSSDPIHIKSLSLSPDPLRFPGNVTVAFQWQTTVDLKSPISVDLKLEKKVGIFWITVPCNMIPGTCHHANICADLAPVTCPPEYQTCHCPFKQGMYELSPTTIPLPKVSVPSGDYKVTGWLKQGSTELGCIHLELAVA